MTVSLIAHIRDGETEAQRGAVTRWRFHSRTWFGTQDVSAQNCHPGMRGGESPLCLPPSLAQVIASLPMKVIGGKLGFLKGRKVDDRMGRSASILLPPPSVCPARSLRLQLPEDAGLSLLLSPRKARCLPFLGRAWGWSRPCLPP